MRTKKQDKGCCDCDCCDCCIGTIDYSLDHLTDSTQILPPIRNSLATNCTMGQQEYLSPYNNHLISFGNISYGRVVDLNKLTNLNGTVLRVKNISFNDTHSLMLIERFQGDRILDSLVYGYGSNQNGELGLDYDPFGKNYYPSWTRVPLDNKIGVKNLIFWDFQFTVENVYTGKNFSLITIISLSDGSLSLYRFQIRKEDKFVYDSEAKPKCVYFENFNTLYNGGIKQVAVFGERILILTHFNYLYIKGTLYDNGNAPNYVLYRKFNNPIRSIHIGINNCLLLGQDNMIYAIGHNDYSEFGLTPEELAINRSNKSHEEIDKIQCGEYFENKFFFINNLRILKISSGARHSLILCDNGKVFCFGDNSDGQCCGLEKVVSKPTMVRFDDVNEFIVDIRAGFNHSIAKGRNGKIYVWGDSAWEKLGFRETRVDQYNPVEISDLKIRNVNRIFAGPMQTAFFTSGGIGI